MWNVLWCLIAIELVEIGMTRSSHPPGLMSLTRRLIESQRLISSGEKVLAAVSGGPDSMALLHVLSRLRAKYKFELFAHGINHGLRPEAQAELEQAAELAEQLAVPFRITAIHLDTSVGNLHAQAREKRFHELRTMATHWNCSKIATAHHKNDRAETVLMRLLSGSGPAGLACLPPMRGDLIRPLLLAGKPEILRYLERQKVSWAEDPSNEHRKYLRAQIRYDILPQLQEISPSIIQHLNDLADDMGMIAPTVFPRYLKRSHRRAVREAMLRGESEVNVWTKESKQTRVAFEHNRFVVEPATNPENGHESELLPTANQSKDPPESD
jgi:tRNA(Ile)-lysidine synthase